MMPLLAMFSGMPDGVMTAPTGAITLSFNGAGQVARTMSVYDTAPLIVLYFPNGDKYDHLQITAITPSHPGGILCEDIAFASNPSSSTTSYYDVSPGWAGPGDYTFTARVRRAASGLYDVVSNPINLTVTP